MARGTSPVRVAVVAAWLAVAGCTEEPPQPGPVSAEHATCDGHGWGVAAYDALYALKMSDGTPLVYADAPRQFDDPAAARRRLEAAAAVDPAPLARPVRLLLQHEIWGLSSRLSATTTSDPTFDPIAEAAKRLERRLALPPAAFAGSADALPPAARSVLDPADGWREVASEMPVLSHERAFGLRRIFRVARRPGEVALFSQLVVRDTEGVAHQTTLTGEVERLTLRDDEVIGAHVHELDRAALRCDDAHRMREVDRVSHVPSLGADFFLGRFEGAPRVADLPCLQCHHDPHLGSLPNETLDPGWRWPALLQQAGAV